MTKTTKSLINSESLKKITSARVGLLRAGSSISTQDILKFDLDHALARDAVHLPFHTKDIVKQLEAREIETIQVHSAAMNRSTYLQRPDLGRQLDENSKLILYNYRSPGDRKFDLAIVIADGLSTRAIHENAVAFIDTFLPLSSANGWRFSPIIIASQARVAIADEVGEILNARLSLILIGERPGLSASDSMGIYLTYAPRKGRTDAERNCISNIRRDGLSHNDAANQLESIIRAALKFRLSGVALKVKNKIIDFQ